MGSTVTLRSSSLSVQLLKCFPGMGGYYGSSPKRFALTSSSPSNPMTLNDVENILNRPTERSSLEEKKKALRMEADFFSYMGTSMPQTITDEMLDKMLETTCGESRRCLWEHFSRRESVGDMQVLLRRRMAQHRMSRILDKVKAAEKENFDGSIYDEKGKNKGGVPFAILPRITETYGKRKLRHRELHGIQFGQNLVFDLGLPYIMDKASVRKFCLNMKSVYNRNRLTWDPFNIFMCNYDPENPALRGLVEDDQCKGYLWNVTKKCFTDVFPREKIVYLSPKSPDKLAKFSHDDIYVIGATGDTYAPLCHERIKELGLRSAKLDLDPYFLRASKNNFDVKEIFRILLDARDTNSNWLYSLRHLSNDKIKHLRWRTKYQHLEDFRDEDANNLAPFESFTSDHGFMDPDLFRGAQVFLNERSILKPRHEDAHLFKEGKTKTRCVNNVYPSTVIDDRATEETTRESDETEDSSVFNWNLDEERAMNELVS